MFWLGMLTSQPSPLSAQTTEVDVELVLAIDVSRSMTPRELEIQRRGYAEALASKEVIEAIKGGLLGRIALFYFEWSGANSQRTIIDWTTIENESDARSVATRLTAEFNEALRRTSISGAIDFAANQFDSNNYTASRQVIDISGDGPNNQGKPVTLARDGALEKGIIINGLPLMTNEGMGSQFHLNDLDQYYIDCVTGGPASFVIPVLEWEQFPEAVRQKLVLELARQKTPGLPANNSLQPLPAAENSYDCLIGERVWRQFRDMQYWP